MVSVFKHNPRHIFHNDNAVTITLNFLDLSAVKFSFNKRLTVA